MKVYLCKMVINCLIDKLWLVVYKCNVYVGMWLLELFVEESDELLKLFIMKEFFFIVYLLFL